MKQLLSVLLIMLLMPAMQLQAQPAEPQLRNCEKLIRKVQNAPGRTQRADALRQLAHYCRTRGLFDEGALSAGYAVSLYKSPQSTSSATGPMALAQAITGHGKPYIIPRNKPKLIKAIIETADNMAHSTSISAQAEKAFKDGIFELWAIDNDAEYTPSKILQADYYLQQQNYAEAERAYKKCVKRAAKLSYSAIEKRSLKSKLATAYLAQKKYGKAKELLREMPIGVLSAKNAIDNEDILCNHACIAIIEKDYTTATEMIQLAYDQYLTTLKPTKFYSPALTNFLHSFVQVARCYEQQKLSTQAMQTYSLMRHCLIATFGTLLPYYIDQDRLNLNHQLQPWYEEIQIFAANHAKLPGMTTFMYDNAQLIKQFFLCSPSIYTPKMSLMQTDSYLRRVRRRIEQWLLTNEAHNAYLKGDILPSIFASMRANALSRDAINYAYSQVNETYDCRTEWKDVQQQMDANEVMIEFVTIPQPGKGTRRYAALVFTKEDSAPHYVPLFQEEKLQKALNDPTRRNAFLLKSLWKPLEQHFSNKSLLTIFPTGLLNTVSFAGIKDKKGVYLCHKYRLAFQLSATDRLRMTYSGTPEGKTAVLFGGADYGLPPSRLPDQVRGQGFHYLPQSRIEVASIAQILKENGCSVRTYTGKEATERTFKRLSDLDTSPYILHLSTHGFYLPYVSGLADRGLNSEGRSAYFDPLLRTGLALTGANEFWKNTTTLNLTGDGVSTAYEITGMALMNTELVVLSACNTGLGEIRDGEGVYGLQRAFRSAGARSMIMSLSEVPDKETAEFMTHFYHNWKKGTPKSVAFRQAQRDMAKKYPAAPEKWAGFILVE